MSQLNEYIERALAANFFFHVSEIIKLRGVDNYKIWARFVLKKMKGMNCFLEMYLNNQFMEIPGVCDLNENEQNLIKLNYDDLTSQVLPKSLNDALYETYCVDRGLKGVKLWNALYSDFGHFSFEQILDRQSKLDKQLHDPAVSMLEKIKLLEFADPEILPLSNEQRIMVFATVCGNRTAKTRLIRLYEKSPENLNWKALKDEISDVFDEACRPQKQY